PQALRLRSLPRLRARVGGGSRGHEQAASPSPALPPKRGGGRRRRARLYQGTFPLTDLPPPQGAPPRDQLQHRRAESQPFNLMPNTRYYRDAVYEQFSKEEYARRYAALRGKMREANLDAVIVPGGPSHWSFGGGMLWLTGHWEWHALCCYVVVPLTGEPTLVYSMG